MKKTVYFVLAAATVFTIAAVMTPLSGQLGAASASFAIYLIDQATGDPVEGADVRLIPTFRHQKEHGNSAFASFLFQPQGTGNYRLEQNLSGDFVLQAVAHGYAPGLKSIRLAGDANQRQVFEMVRSGVIRGIVTDADNRRLRGVRLSVAYTDPEVFSIIETMTSTGHYGFGLSNEFGEYRIDSGVLPGKTFLLEVIHENFQAHLTQEARAEPNTPLEIDVTLAEPGTVFRGVVEDQSGNPVSGTVVILKATRPARSRVLKLQDGRQIQSEAYQYHLIAREASARLNPQSVTGADGSFLFRGLPPGDVQVRIRGRGYRPYRETMDLEPGDNFAKIVLTEIPAKRP